MLKLHGTAVSNYYKMVHLALLEKGLAFETAVAYPNTSPEFLIHSPRGKVPYLETGHGDINETSAILDYLEESQNGRPLLPADPFARAQVRALMRELELYIELPARTCFGEAFFGGTVPEAIKAKAHADLLAGFATLKRHAKFAPYIAGDAFTLADIYFLYCSEVAIPVAQRLFKFDPLEDMPRARALLDKLADNPHVQKIAAESTEALPAFMAYIEGKK
jgi:glutathione S-transferase